MCLFFVGVHSHVLFRMPDTGELTRVAFTRHPNATILRNRVRNVLEVTSLVYVLSSGLITRITQISTLSKTSLISFPRGGAVSDPAAAYLQQQRELKQESMRPEVGATLHKLEATLLFLSRYRYIYISFSVWISCILYSYVAPQRLRITPGTEETVVVDC